MGAVISYQRDEALERAVRCIIESAGLNHIDPSRVYVIRSRGSRSRAIARIYSMPSAWRYALNMEPAYLIEFISERFDGLTPERKAEVIVHELLHIPMAFSGGLRPHGKYVNDRLAARIAARVDRSCLEALSLTGQQGLGR
ncbi:putative metallopeptidase [Acidilobus sp.]|uniref:putative metallopeptidase n=1 Tax=Acidilobus sp. TaxID=1872109 RepID=UPI003CFFF4B5